MRFPTPGGPSPRPWSAGWPAWAERGAVVLLAGAAAAAVWLGSRLPPARQAVLAGVLLLAGAAVLRRGWVRLAGPVLLYDLVRTVRRGRLVAARCLYAGTLSGLLCWLYYFWSLRFRGQVIPAGDVARFAETFFGAFAVVQFGMAVLFTPLYLAPAVAEEKERRTLEFLLATDLRNREIVLGKVFARLASLLLLLLAGLPVLAFLQFLGGVDPDLVLASGSATALTVLSLAGLGILCSVYCRRSRDAILLTYLLAGSYVGVSAAALTLLDLPSFPADFVLLAGPEPYTVGDLPWTLNAGNPFVATWRLFDGVARGGTVADGLAGLLGGYAFVHGLTALVGFTWAVARVRAVALKQVPAVAPRRGWRLRAWRVRWWRPPVGRWPMLWKELFAEPPMRFGWLGRVLVGLLLVALLVPAGTAATGFLISTNSTTWTDVMNGWLRGVAAAGSCLTLLSVAVRASGAISGERDRQTLDALLTTPLGAWTILGSKWLGCLASTRWAWLLLVLVWAQGAALGGLDPQLLPVQVIAWLVYASLLAWIGLWCSLACRTSLQASLATLLATVVVAVGHWLLWLLYLPYFFLHESPVKDVEWLARLHFGLTPPAVLSWLTCRSDELFYDPQLWSLALYAVLGVCAWAVGGLVLALVTVARFRRRANRAPLRRPAATPSVSGVTTDMPLDLREPADRPGRRRLVLAALTLVPLALIGGFYYHLARQADRRLQAVIAELDARAPGWRFRDLEAARKVLEPEQNAAEQVRAARRLLPRQWPPAPAPRPAGAPGLGPPLLENTLAEVPPERQLDHRQTAELRQLLAEVGPARDAARRVADLPEGRIPVVWGENLFATLLPDLQETRTVGRLLQYDAFLRAQDGDLAGAWESVRAMVNTGRSIGDEPLLISQLVRMAHRTLAAKTGERLLAQGEVPASLLARVQEQLAADARDPLLLYAARGERGAFHEMMEDIRRGKVQLSALGGPGSNKLTDLAAAAASKGSHTWGLTFYNEYVAALQLPAAEQADALARLEARGREAPWVAKLMLPAVTRFADSYRRTVALQQCLVVALAAERHRLARDRWPATLDALVPGELPAVPADPCDGQPLRYRLLEDGAVVYSVGPDGRDDGGQADNKNPYTKGDVVVRLWDAARRRRPPLNPEVGPPQPVTGRP